MKAWFISDIHLKSPKERNGEILLRFLRSLQQQPDPSDSVLFLLGDIFDLWIGGHEVFADRYRPIVEDLKKLKQMGFRVVFIEGNHDVHIEQYFGLRLGFEVHVEAQVYDLNGLKVRVEHGDLINQGDRAYLRYRSTIRHPLMKWLAQNVSGRFWNWLGEKASAESRKHSSKYREDKEQELIGYIRDHAQKLVESESLDVVVSGHMHVFDDWVAVNSKGRSLRSFNLGSWLSDEVKVLHLTENAEWKILELESVS